MPRHVDLERLSDFGEPTQPIDKAASTLVRVNAEIDEHKKKVDKVSKNWMLIRVYLKNMNSHHIDIFQLDFDDFSQALYGQLVKVRAVLSKVLTPQEFRDMQTYFQASSEEIIKEGYIQARDLYHELNISD